MAPIGACPSVHEWQAFVLGKTPDPEAEPLGEHLAACRACLTVAGDLTGTDPLLETVRAEAKGPSGLDIEADDDLIARLCSLRAPVHLADDSVVDESVALAHWLAPAEMPDELGRVGPYGILRVLGRGGMGIVFAARQIRPRRTVALKILHAGPGAGGRRLERFRSESEILARLRHPNIVQVYEVGEHDALAFFTMELAAGGNLAQKLASAPLLPRAAAELLQTLARAVHSAHEQGIVHRDLKPSNVLLTVDGTALIADFGLAKEWADEQSPARGPLAPCTDRTETGVILGTPSYMAPEQAGGLREDIGPAADVYALGAILYECLTGRPPFKAATALETLEQMRTQDPLAPGRLQPGLPRDLQTICLRCLEKEPRRRFASAQALADDLERFKAGKPILARRVQWWERAWKWARRKPALAALILVCLLSAGALVAGVLVHNARLQHAVDKAETNADEAFRQKELARDHYRRARDTVEMMLKQFKAFRLGEVPQLKELERRQLEDALAFYLGALKDQDDPDPVIRADAALATKRAGDLQGIVGKQAQAIESFGRAMDMLDALPPELRNRPENRYLLAVCCNHRGLMSNQLGRWDDAAREHDKALQILSTMAQEQPREAQWRQGLADTEHYLGALCQVSQKLDQAEVHHRRAAAHSLEMVRDWPEVEGYQAKLADTEINLALLLQSTKRPDEARRYYETAEGRLRTLFDRHPTEGEYALSLTALYSNWSYLLGAAGAHDRALAKLTRAVELAEGVLKQEPTHLVARSRALNAHGASAQLYEGLGRWADAAREWDRVIALDTQPVNWTRRVLRAVALARAGDHVRAMAEADVMANDPRVSADGLFELARVCALCAGFARKDAQVNMADRKTRAEHDAAQGVALLKKLHANGYFKTPENALALMIDPDLQELRGRADFPKLLPPPKADKQ